MTSKSIQRSTRRLIVADQNTGRIAYLYSHEQTTKYMPHWKTGAPRECWRPIEVTPSDTVRVFWVRGNEVTSEWLPNNDSRIVKPDESFLLIAAANATRRAESLETAIRNHSCEREAEPA